MCGITGYIDFKKKTTTSDLRRMNNSLIHRGPDDGQIYEEQLSDYFIGLAHRRLSIIELSELGTQPMFYKDYIIVFNGEIYNYKEIKNELIALSHQFISNSDTEVILHAYEQWGNKCLDKFNGMFSFVIYHSTKKQLFIARDRAGVKPFYFSFKNELFLFGSELKAIVQHPTFSKVIDFNSVALFMQYGTIPTPYTIYQDCYKLKPGHYLEFDLRAKKITENCYWNVNTFYEKPKLDITFLEAKEQTTDILSSAFKYRMIADVPVGIFLSGGYDSASVAAILKKVHSKQIDTFTIGFENKFRDEAPEAKKIANYLQTNHTEYYCTERDLLELIDLIPFHYDEPFGDSSAIPTMMVSKIAKRNVSVALSADGGDELFAGYYRYHDFELLRKKITNNPKFLLSFGSLLMNNVNPNHLFFLNKRNNFVNRYEKIKDILKYQTEKSIFDALNKQFTDSQVSDLFLKDINLYSIFYNGEPKNTTPLSYIMSLDYQTYLNDVILQKVDRASMAYSLEGRDPFLDNRIVEFVAQLPDKYKYFDGEKKYLLKEIVHDYIPKSLMERPKKGFAIPLSDWLKGELKSKVDHFVNKNDIEKQGIFKWNEIENIKHLFYSGKKEYDMKLWYILTFQMWYKQWMEN